MFISDASGLPQIYTVASDGGDPQQVTADNAGVLLAVMSDDGKVAWYFSASARLYRVHLDTGEVQEGLGRTPQLGDITRIMAGSIYAIPGAGFSERLYVAAAFAGRGILKEKLGQL